MHPEMETSIGGFLKGTFRNNTCEGSKMGQKRSQATVQLQ